MSAFHLYGKTGGKFPPNGIVRMGKTVVPLSNQMEPGSFHWQLWVMNRSSHQGAWYVSVMRQMVQ